VIIPKTAKLQRNPNPDAAAVDDFFVWGRPICDTACMKPAICRGQIRRLSFFWGGRTIEDCSAAGKAVIPYHACDCMVFWLSVFDN
jgi:hypothetical protein